MWQFCMANYVCAIHLTRTATEAINSELLLLENWRNKEEKVVFSANVSFLKLLYFTCFFLSRKSLSASSVLSVWQMCTFRLEALLLSMFWFILFYFFLYVCRDMICNSASKISLEHSCRLKLAACSRSAQGCPYPSQQQQLISWNSPSHLWAPAGLAARSRQWCPIAV